MSFWQRQQNRLVKIQKLYTKSKNFDDMLTEFFVFFRNPNNVNSVTKHKCIKWQKNFLMQNTNCLKEENKVVTTIFIRSKHKNKMVTK